MRIAEGWAEVMALGKGSVGPRVLLQGELDCRRGLAGPCLFTRTE